MKTAWDYTNLAESYLKRPTYSKEAVDEIIKRSEISADAKICDVGAGVAHLTLEWATRSFQVVAVEPNDAMRKLGQKKTQSFSNVKWIEGTGEETHQSAGDFDLVSFGSSFNVMDRQKALTETARILKPRGWMACLWNHRDLQDPLQKTIEEKIKSLIADYNYGTRREDQTDMISSHAAFEGVQNFEGRVIHQQSINDCLEAWRSHATLARQAGERFDEVIGAIEKILGGTSASEISIPYTTRVWMGRKRPG